MEGGCLEREERERGKGVEMRSREADWVCRNVGARNF